MMCRFCPSFDQHLTSYSTLNNPCNCCSFVKWSVAQCTSSWLICEEQDLRAWNGLRWLRTGPGSGLLWIRWWNFVFYKSRLKFLNILPTLCFSKERFLHATTVGLFVGGGMGGTNVDIPAAQLPVCVTYLLLAACESVTGHSGCILGVQKRNWNTTEHVGVTKSWCIYVARF
jgi:hypothetical protein